MCIGRVGEQMGMVSVKLSAYFLLRLADPLSERCMVKEPRTTSPLLGTVVPER